MAYVSCGGGCGVLLWAAASVVWAKGHCAVVHHLHCRLLAALLLRWSACRGGCLVDPRQAPVAPAAMRPCNMLPEMDATDALPSAECAVCYGLYGLPCRAPRGLAAGTAGSSWLPWLTQYSTVWPAWHVMRRHWLPRKHQARSWLG